MWKWSANRSILMESGGRFADGVRRLAAADFYAWVSFRFSRLVFGPRFLGEKRARVTHIFQGVKLEWDAQAKEHGGGRDAPKRAVHRIPVGVKRLGIRLGRALHQRIIGGHGLPILRRRQ